MGTRREAAAEALLSSDGGGHHEALGHDQQEAWRVNAIWKRRTRSSEELVNKESPNVYQDARRAARKSHQSGCFETSEVHVETQQNKDTSDWGCGIRGNHWFTSQIVSYLLQTSHPTCISAQF